MKRGISGGILIVLASLFVWTNACAGKPDKARSKEETEILTKCFSAIAPGDSASLVRHASDETMEYCLVWQGFSLRSEQNTDLEADYSNAITELYRTSSFGYADCMVRATVSLAPWQKQKIYEAEASERENRLFHELDRRRIVFKDEGPARAVGDCFSWPQVKID